MKLALVDRTVAQETEDNIVVLAVAGSECQTDGDGHLGAHDGVAAHETSVRVEEVQGAASGARGLSAQLGHGELGVHTFGQSVAVVAVVADDVIGVTERGDGPDGHGLLARIQMQEPLDHALHVQAAGGFLKAADQKHAPVEVDGLALVQARGRARVSVRHVVRTSEGRATSSG